MNVSDFDLKAFEFDKKYLRKGEENIIQNIEYITIKMKTIV